MTDRTEEAGFVDWNKYNFDKLADHLEDHFKFSSSGTAKAASELIRFYRENKDFVNTVKQAETEEAAEKHAYLVIPNPSPNVAGYYTTGDQWDFVKESYKIGAKWMQSQYGATPKEVKELQIKYKALTEEYKKMYGATPEDYQELREMYENSSANNAELMIQLGQVKAELNDLRKKHTDLEMVYAGCKMVCGKFEALKPFEK